jgi:hypothetical protein
VESTFLKANKGFLRKKISALINLDQGTTSPDATIQLPAERTSADTGEDRRTSAASSPY